MSGSPTHPSSRTDMERRALAAKPGMFLLLAGAIVLLVGWGMGVDIVTRVVPGLASMKVNTALGVAALGGATMAHGRGRRGQVIAVACGFLVLLLGALTLVQYVFGVDLGIDQLLVVDTEAAEHPGRMGANTAIAFVSLGLSWVVLACRPSNGVVHVAGQAIASVGGFLSLFALVGYALESASTRGIGRATEMAVHTSVSLVVATVALAIATSDRGPLRIGWSSRAGGRVLRGLLAPVTVVVLGIGVIVDRVESAGLLADLDLQLALVTTLTLVMVAALVQLMASRLERVAVAEEDALAALERAHLRLATLNEDLERRVALRTAELATTNDELERSNADLAQFAYVASHDLKEPLRMVSAYCTRIGERYRDKLDDRGRTYVDLAVDAADRMQDMIDALLRYSRVGREELEVERVDLVDMVTEVLRHLGAPLGDVDVQVAPDLPDVVVDPDLFGHVLQNLIGNAGKFRDPARAPVIAVRGWDSPRGTVLEVADNGIGVPPKHRDRIFQMFQRLHKRDAYEGTGIGLALVARIVGRHGGTVEVGDSDLGGATFRITLPNAPLRSAPNPQAAEDTDGHEGTTVAGTAGGRQPR